MGFKLPGKSIQTGTSGHSSALKMVTEQRAASALKKKSYEQAFKDRSDTYKGMNQADYTAEAKRQNKVYKETGKWDVKKSYADSKPEEKVNTEKVVTSTTGDETDNNSVRTTGKDQNASSIDSTEKESKESVVTSAKADLKDTKKQNKINTLKGKKDVADAKGKSKRSQRIANRIERKESRLDGDKSTNVSRRDQRKARKATKTKNAQETINRENQDKYAPGPNASKKDKANPKSYQDKKKERQSSYDAAKDKEQARFDGKQ